jgi:hypothetical protein
MATAAPTCSPFAHGAGPGYSAIARCQASSRARPLRPWSRSEVTRETDQVSLSPGTTTIDTLLWWCRGQGMCGAAPPSDDRKCRV